MTQERKRTIAELHIGILTESKDVDGLLWEAVLAFQDYPLRTVSGLPFSYRIKRKKNGEYSGEILVSRKEGSKTLTKSPVLLAFHTVLKRIETMPPSCGQESGKDILEAPEYSGPKAIGQIFGISYIYSLFWLLGLIKVPEKIGDRLSGTDKAENFSFI
ncbi:MAG TPA: hypothetical protein IAA12_08640 [Candidatus Blautia intestinipullorum]|nr:hypothetical protein [Candidatus Blautia intestinipullorum]